ncbi:MAG: hypothetical protein J5717_01575 [Lachnospiraceae bacterium]|nr:hypothetical protein [Lachnospiraceae bacterium]
MAKKWITRVLVLGIVAFVMFKTKGFFDDLTDGTYDHAIVSVAEAMSKNNSSKKENKGSGSSTSTSTSVSVPEVVYEPTDKTGDDFYLDLSQASLWNSGEYDAKTGEKAEQKRRLRYPDIITIECSKYNIQLTEGFTLRFCEYDKDNAFIRSVDLAGGDVFTPSKDGEFFSITLIKNEGEKSLSPGQWNRLISAGIQIVICTDKWLNFSGEETGSLIGGETGYAQSEDLSELLFAGKDEELSQILWNEQIKNGIYTLSAEELNTGWPTYYVSSSDGDDSNSGLTREEPKKKLEYFSGMSNVNVLLKCGDTFEVPQGYKLGSNCIYAAYGSGARPKISFYRNLDVKFTPSEGINNVWQADLSGLEIVTGQEDSKDNCDIGQLILDGEVNWKRYVWSSKEQYNPHYIEERGEGAWAVDWRTNILYLYSETNPNDIDIKYAPPINGLSGSAIKNTVIKGLDVSGAGRHCLNLINCENVEVSCCYFHHIGGSVQSSSGMRYGNAVQVWNGAKSINIHNNYASWIFDTCFTNQGSDRESLVEHVHFTDNLGAHFYWGIEAWGEAYTDKPFNDVTYTGNVLYDNIDLTNPTTRMHANSKSKLLGTKDSDYVSYRTGYKFHQMSSINLTNSGTGQITKIENNIAWNSNRFLVFATNSRKEEHFSALKNNLLYAENVLKGGRLMRFNESGQKIYCEGPDYLDSSNDWSVHFSGEEYDNSGERSKLSAALNKIAGR